MTWKCVRYVTIFSSITNCNLSNHGAKRRIHRNRPQARTDSSRTKHLRLLRQYDRKCLSQTFLSTHQMLCCRTVLSFCTSLLKYGFCRIIPEQTRNSWKHSMVWFIHAFLWLKSRNNTNAARGNTITSKITNWFHVDEI